MLNKLLKYDLRAIFKYWWIAALSSLGLSAVGGISLDVFTDLIAKTTLDGTESWTGLLSLLGIILCIIGLSAFLISSEIFVYVRLYKHLFSDEGYLTFTLPVKRCDILNSKLISGLVVNLSTMLVLLVDVAILLIIGIDSADLSRAFAFCRVLADGIFRELGGLSALYIFEAIAAIFIMATASYLMIAICITFAAMIAKKYKIFAAIGIYYLATAVMSFVGQIGATFGVVGIADLFSSIPEGSVPPVLSLMILSLLLLCAAITYLLYTLELYMLDKKLNLS